MLRPRALELSAKKIREDPQPQPLSLLSLCCQRPAPAARDPLRARLQQHPRVDLVASVLVELENMLRRIVVNLIVDKKVHHLALHLAAPVAIGLLDQANAPADGRPAVTYSGS